MLFVVVCLLAKFLLMVAVCCVLCVVCWLIVASCCYLIVLCVCLSLFVVGRPFVVGLCLLLVVR